MDELLAALEGASGTSARLIDLPPLEVQALKQSLTDLRSDAASLPSPAELSAVYDALVRESEREKRSLLEVSLGIGLAFFNSARKVGRQHVLDPYTEDLRPVRDEGFGAYARRVGRPYADAVVRHFSPSEKTLGERGVERLARSKLLESRGMAHPDSFGARSRLTVGEREVELFRLDALQERFDVLRLPYTLRILLENVLRNENGVTVTAADVEAVAGWVAAAEPSQAISFTPGRVLHQDFTGVPAIVDLAAMRNAMADLGGEAAQDQPAAARPSSSSTTPSRWTSSRRRFAIRRNSELEFERNRERYAFLRWGQSGFANFKVVPPATGIVHQVNLEFLARVVDEREGTAFPDTLLGTDSHTTMINGLGVLGWGVGGHRGRGRDARRTGLDARPAGRRLQAHGRAAGGRDGDRPRPDRDADPARDRRRREVRRVLRARPRRAPARGSRDHREHVARVRRDLRLLPRRRRDDPLSPPHRAFRGADRARRGVLQGERALARPRGGADVHAGRRARPLDGRAVAGRPEAAAGQSSAPRREAGVPRGAAELRRRLRELARRGGRRDVPGERPAGLRLAGSCRDGGRRRRGRRAGGDRGDAGRRRGHARRPHLRAGARLRRHRGDHVVHEHVEPGGHGRRRPAREEGRRARLDPEAVGEVEPRAGVEGRHPVLRQGRPDAVPRAARLPHRRVRLHDVHRQLRPAARGDLEGDSRRRHRRRAPSSRGTGTSRRASIPR